MFDTSTPAPEEQPFEVVCVDPSGLSDDELLDGVRALERARTRLDAAEADLLAELAGRQVCDTQHGLTTATWLAREAGLPSGLARKRVQVAERLRAHLPSVDVALHEGRITWEHARVLADACIPRLADAVAGVQDTLLDLADGTLFDHWKRDVTGIVDLLDQDGGHDPDADLARNKLSVSRTFDGVTHLDGTLVGEHAEYVRQAVEAKTDELYRRFRDDHRTCPEIPVPARPVLRALALAELCRQASGVDLSSSQAPRTDVTLVAQASDPTAAADPDGVRLADGTTRTLLCDADLHPLVVDSLGVPLDLGHTIRYASLAQRRAIARRDGGCVFPGCTTPPTWCDHHHLTRYPVGPTDLANLVALCRHHHNLVHRPGWSLHAVDGGWFTFQSPRGHRFESQRHGRRRPPDERTRAA